MSASRASWQVAFRAEAAALREQQHAQSSLDLVKAFEKVDLIASPTSPTAAFKIGEKVDDPLQMYLSDIYTISANLASICGISIPCGFTSGNLPIGLQLLGRPFGEEQLLRAAHAYEQATNWHTRRPSVN